MVSRRSPAPFVTKTDLSSTVRLRATSGRARAKRPTADWTRVDSEAAERRNFRLAGRLWNSPLTVTEVPGAAPTRCLRMRVPASSSTWMPESSPSARETIVTRDTAAMLGRASPRKPNVPTDSKSPSLTSLLVANRSNAVATSSSAMPMPLSVTRMYSMPPPLISTDTLLAPASSEFSTSSLTTDIGRSVTSPAAIFEAILGLRTRMGMAHIEYHCVGLGM